ncbi:hypothetical protein FQN54_008744 [Arachnomyces sp. PD_36]|nr:hypothetical protein FQN54_008744 [Arachnomyces sp. PD_36]
MFGARDDKEEDSDTTEDLAVADRPNHIPPTDTGSTLLPRPIASLVTLVTQSTSLSLRVGTYVGGAAIDGARVTTLTGLELSRAVVEGILTRAGRDVAGRSDGEYGQAEAESLLERSLAILHTTVTSASFFASAGFHLSSTTLSSFTSISQNLLSTIDAIVGSTESSRAIAAIVTLIRKEFQKPEAVGITDQKVGVGDLLVGSIGFALLQRWGRRKTERIIRERGGEEIVWDIVILDDGLRADVVGLQQGQYSQGGYGGAQDHLSASRPASFLSPEIADGAFEAIERERDSIDRHPPDVTLARGQNEVSDEDIRKYIMSQLPRGAHASVRTEMVTAKTITVDIFDDGAAEISAPPGTTMVEERFHHPDNASFDNPNRVPKHTVVFRSAFNRLQMEDLHPEVVAKQTASVNQPRIPALERSSSSTARLEPSKSAMGKSSLTKFAQKVKPSPSGDKANLKKTSAKKPSGNSSHSHSASRTGQNSSAVKGRGEAPSASNTLKRPYSASTNKGGLQNNDTNPQRPGFGSRSPQHNSKSTKRHPLMDVPGRTSSLRDFYPTMAPKSPSFVAQTDTFSVHSIESRPGSPTVSRTHIRSSSSMSRTPTEKDLALPRNGGSRPGSSSRHHQRSRSIAHSLYSLADNGSDTSLMLAPRSRRNSYQGQPTMSELSRTGRTPGTFPSSHLVQNIRRFMRFSSASYGSNFLRMMGISEESAAQQSQNESNHYEHSSFSTHTGLPTSTILLSSFYDPAGGSNATGETAAGFPLVHYLSLDHDSKAVVLTLRGTFGFEDILTDMTCDYDGLQWQGRSWQVHKGMHASARHLLEGGGGRVMATIKAALEEFTDYGVIFCGHSLGGGVASLLATLISEPNSSDTISSSFVTASNQPATGPLLLAENNTATPEQAPSFSLPSGRPIHVYAYGPPAVMSPFLRRATRGLITTIVNGQDVVPSLSLGVLHDFHAVSVVFKSDTSGAKSHVRSRVWEGITQSIVNKFYVNDPPSHIHAGDGVGEDTWAWDALKSLREDMIAPKLTPPGEVFVVDTMRVLQRDAFTSDIGGEGYPRLGKPATRVQLKFIKDVESWFGEIRFGSGMLGDHNPARYEANLAALARGVLED